MTFTRVCIMLALTLAGFSLAACTSSSARQDNLDAYRQGRFEAFQEMQRQQQPQVFFQGFFKNPALPWREGLTLAEALIAAEYVGLQEPKEIQLKRQGSTQIVVPQRLLRGQDNPLLLPGDVIVVR